jgi:hypothetical protein
MRMIELSLSTTSYTTVGAVVIRSMSNSRSRRSCTMSMCSRPRKPQRKPKPSACETSGSNCSEESFRRSFSSESRSWSYSEDSTGYRPANTCGLISLKPGSGARLRLVGERDGVAHLGRLDLLDAGDDEADLARAQRSRLTECGVNTPTWSHGYCAVRHQQDAVLGLELPSTTRTSITTPT